MLFQPVVELSRAKPNLQILENSQRYSPLSSRKPVKVVKMVNDIGARLADASDMK